jgi:hypothetical protein
MHVIITTGFNIFKAIQIHFKLFKYGNILIKLS